MKYNVRYRKLVTETIENEWFCKHYLDGMTPAQWADRAKEINASITRADNEKNALALAKPIHQGPRQKC